MKARLELTAKYLRQCGIQLLPTTIIEAEAPNRLITNIAMPHGKAGGPQLKFAESLGDTKKPIIFYIGKTSDEVMGYARTEKDAGSRTDPSVNTAWISAEVLSQHYIKERGPFFINESHELGHLLGDWLGEGHSIDPDNIMSATGTKFNKDQCEAYQANELVSEIGPKK